MEVFRIGLIPVYAQDIVDILLLTALLYALLRWLYRQNLLNVAILLFLLISLGKVAHLTGLETLNFLLRQLALWLGMLLAIALAPELRRTLYALRPFGKLPFLRREVVSEDKIEKLATEILQAVNNLASRGLGAIIVIEGNDDLGSYAQTGDSLLLPVEARMLLMLFDRRSPLHDGAVIIRGDKIVAARCTLPVSDRTDLPETFGQRHRAAIGISESTDALVVVVSEETRLISTAQRGELRRVTPVELKKQLVEFYAK
ncbi:MAG: diadenylate cyclase [Bacteroidia bacterium]